MGISESSIWNFSEHNAVHSAWLSATKMHFCLVCFLVEALHLDSTFCTTAFQHTEPWWELGECIWLQWSWTQNHVHPTGRQPKHHSFTTPRLKACCLRMGRQKGVSLCAQQAHADCLLSGVFWGWLPGSCYLRRIKISLLYCVPRRKKPVFQMHIPHVLFTPVPHWWMIPWKAIDSHYV